MQISFVPERNDKEPTEIILVPEQNDTLYAKDLLRFACADAKRKTAHGDGGVEGATPPFAVGSKRDDGKYASTVACRVYKDVSKKGQHGVSQCTKELLLDDVQLGEGLITTAYINAGKNQTQRRRRPHQNGDWIQG